jgi:hypothetical protein
VIVRLSRHRGVPSVVQAVEARGRSGRWFGRPADVHDAHAFAEVHMVLRFEGEGGRSTDAAQLDG